MEKKLTIIETSKYLGVSKEAIYNRLRRGTLDSVVEDGKKYVILTQSVQREGKLPKRTSITNNQNSEYVEFLKTQIEELKEKNQKLENDKEQLQCEKEKMLIESKEKLEQIYKDRDEQLKTILTLVNVPTLEHKLKEETIEIVEEIEIEEDIVDKICESFKEWEKLTKYFKRKDFSQEQMEKIEKKVKKQVGKSSHVKMSNDELYVKKDIKLKKIIGKI